MLPRVGLFGALMGLYRVNSNDEDANTNNSSNFDEYLSKAVQRLDFNAEKVFEMYEKPKYDFFAAAGKLINGMVFTPGKGIIPRWVKGYSNVYVRMVLDGRLIEFTGLRDETTGEYAYKDIRVKEIPAWWKWSTEHFMVSRIGDSNMGYFFDFDDGVKGATEFMGIRIERNPYESFDHIADALDFLQAQGEDVKEYATKIYQQIMENGDEESKLALSKWLKENQERLERWGIGDIT